MSFLDRLSAIAGPSLLFALFLVSCATPPGRQKDASDGRRAEDVQTQTKNGVTVSAWIVPDTEARRRYGVDLSRKRIQAVWLRVENKSPDELWLLHSFVDPDYYTAEEAARLFRRWVPTRIFGSLRQDFHDLEIRSRLDPGSTHEGHVLVPLEEGGRYVQITVGGGTRVERFGFPLRTPDGHFDFEDVDPTAIYPDQELPELSLEQFRKHLKAMPCCATNADGSAEGDPLNIVIVGEPEQMMAALSESGWSFTHRIDWTSIRREIRAALVGGRYETAPVSSLYAFGRSQDLAFQRSRSTISQRNHMRLWLAPYLVEGRSVWAGQVSRDIGIKFTKKSSTFTTHVIDPAVDEARQYVLESLLFRNRIDRLGFVRAFDRVTSEEPRMNLTGDEWESDGMRLVVLLSDGPVKLDHVRDLGWAIRNRGPIESLQSGGE